MNRVPVWIDTDTGVDDAIALLVALKLDRLDVVGVSAVCGNTTIENAFENARNTVSLGHRDDIKVYRGSAKPLIVDLKIAPHIHGENGIGDAYIPKSKAKEETLNAWDALYETAKKYNGELVVCAVGPLTNIAITIAKYPDFINYVKELNIMGGSVVGGNVTPCAEFNIYADPHAAENVFKSGLKVNMFGLDVTLKAFLDLDSINEIYSYNNPQGKLLKESCSYLLNYNEGKDVPGFAQHDSCPIIYTAYPEIFKGEECAVYVETASSIAMGKTVTDLYSDFQFPIKNTKVFLDVDVDKFFEIFKKCFKSY